MSPRIRRFEPWCGVSRAAIEQEAIAVHREVGNYLLLSLADLREKLSERGTRWNHADEALHAAVTALPECERLAIQCLVVRDLHYVVELYLEWCRTHAPKAEAPAPLAPPPPAEGPRAVPFSEWLFTG